MENKPVRNPPSLLMFFAIALLIASFVFAFLILPQDSYLNRIRIKRPVNNYFSALSEGRYELAKTYCVQDGSYYKFVDSEKKRCEERLLYNPTYTPYINNYYPGWVDVEIVITASNLFGINVRETANTLIFLVKEKR